MSERQRAVPALPEQLDGHSQIEWTRWEPALVLTHIDRSCQTCGHPGPPVHAYGIAESECKRTLPASPRQPGQARTWRTVRERRRVRCFLASRCRDCDEMRIYALYDKPQPEQLMLPGIEGLTKTGPKPARRHTMHEVYYVPPRTRNRGESAR